MFSPRGSSCPEAALRARQAAQWGTRSPASVAQLDARQDDQEVAGSTPAESATFFRGV